MDGHAGSSLFLLITGYVVYFRYRDDGGFSWRRYSRARAFRILPLFWVVLATYVVVDLLTDFRGKLPHDPWSAAVVILQNASLVAPFCGSRLLLEVSWTLSYVAIGYVTTPLLARWFDRMSLGHNARLLALAAYGFLWLALEPLGLPVSANGVNLALGMMICEAGHAGMLTRVRTRVVDAVAVLALCAVVVVTGFAKIHIPFRMLATALPLSFLLAGRIGGVGWIDVALMTRTAQWIGRVGYSSYFAHGAVLLLLREVVAVNRPFLRELAPDGILLVGTLGFGYALCLGAAAGLYYGVEAPLQRWFRPRRRTVPVEVPAAVPVHSRGAVA
jgi:peptidoglycan/LPS O-acetylase OafA/YrhL